MGNNPSTTSKAPHHSSSASSTPTTPNSTHHESSKTHPNRRDPRGLIHAQQRAPVEPSLAQARGTTTAAHRPRNSQSQTAAAVHQSSANPALIDHSPQSVTLQNTAHQPKVEINPTNDYHNLSKPVDVPVTTSTIEAPNSPTDLESIDIPGLSVAQDMAYHLTRPPRLPLPIEEEVHTPGSPIIAPSDIEAPLLDIESLDHEALPRRTSALSNTTIDEEDAEELQVDKTKATVPTTFEWRQGGDKVYVTGTIFQWNKKHRLHPVDGQQDLLRAIIHVRPGTHHIRFIVDTVMQCSNDLPTTVDFGNNLVNYIEVSADDIPQDPANSTELTDVPEVDPQARSTSPSNMDNTTAVDDESAADAKPAPRVRAVLPRERYSSQVPQYLLDLDKSEESNEYQHAAAAIEKLPTPPSLPGFLGKPILNAATPMKDDNSVLTMPNHTVLNHLATSSIKNNVLAVSATTRYKRKYVTTIMYKPTGDD